MANGRMSGKSIRIPLIVATEPMTIVTTRVTQLQRTINISTAKKNKKHPRDIPFWKYRWKYFKRSPITMETVSKGE